MPKVFTPEGWNRLLKMRFPTILGLALLLVGVGAGIFLVGQGTGGFLPRASADTIPKQVRVTNVTDTSFSVSFLTDAAAPGYLKYGTQVGQYTTRVADDRDQLTNTSGTFTTHHITVRGLQPTTQYTFQLGTGSSEMFDNNGQPFTIRTARRLDNPPEARTAYGSVLNEVGNPAANALIYVSVAGASPLSTLVKDNGSWAVPLSSLRTTDLSAGKTLQDADLVKIQVIGTNQGQVTEVTAAANKLAPLETITFGKTVSQVTTSPSPDAAATTTETPPPDTTQTSPPPTTGSTTDSFGNLYSAQEASQVNTATPVKIDLQNNETISATKPEFVGKAPPNSTLQIEVHSTPQAGVVQTDANGDWKWSPPADLEPGQHSVTLTYTDANGAQQQIVRTFIVQANSQLPSFVSTPSADLATPTPEPSPSVPPLPSPVPVEPSPSPRVAEVVPTDVPVTGAVETTYSILAVAAIFFIVGIWATRSFLSEKER